MKVKTDKLTGAALNWVVASIEWPNDSGILNPELMSKESVNEEYPFDKDWSLTGPIIVREDIDLIGSWENTESSPNVYSLCRSHYSAGIDFSVLLGHKYTYKQDGPSKMIAALRCFIASKLSDEVEVPDHLL